MKKLVAILIILLFASPVLAQDFRFGSGVKTSSGIVATGPGVLTQIIVGTDGTNSPTIDLYDNTAASGTKLVPQWYVYTSAFERIATLPIDNERFFNGLYVNISGTANVVLLYKQ
ncbi:MAG: hypothetical protein WC455_17325 [Dehalococcoidia bacterium]|jgi:hypothetical protein